MNRIVLLFASLLMQAPPPADDPPPSDKPAATQPSQLKPAPRPAAGVQTFIRFACSPDGLHFTPEASAADIRGIAPALVRHGDGSIWMICRASENQSGRRGLSLAVSDDAGRTWTPPRPVKIENLPPRLGEPRSHRLVKLPGGEIELHLLCEDRRGKQTFVVAKSLGRDVFSVRRKLRLPEGVELLDCAAAYVGDRCHVYGTRKTGAPLFFHGLISGGSRIMPVEPVQTLDVGSPSCVVAIDGGFRLYASAPEGAASAASADGAVWYVEPGVRLAGAGDPAVVRLTDGTYLMAYVNRIARARDTGLSTEGGVETAKDDSAHLAEGTAEPALDELLEGHVAESDASQKAALTDAPAAAPVGSMLGVPGIFDFLFALPIGPETALETSSASTGIPPRYRLDDVPIPDFITKVDYRAWLEARHDASGLSENAYDYYARLFPNPLDPPGTTPELPTLVNMFADLDFTGPPGPWRPEDHPVWDASSFLAEDLVARFSEAAAVGPYMDRLRFASDAAGDQAPDADSKDLLFGILLPHLPGHRSLVKQVLSDAWRAPEGRPDPLAMMDAFETAVGCANHMQQGDFLIESLVATAEKALVQENARWALAHGVFKADEIEATLEMLDEKDRPLADPADWVAGELAAELDIVQYMHGPFEAGRAPKLNPERARRILESLGDEQKLRTPMAELVDLSDPHKTSQTLIEYFNEFADLARRGYPEVTAKDLDDLTEQFAARDELAPILIPSLSRVHRLVHRQEASRRATQLSYAIHLHRARTGNWPNRLDELPPDRVRFSRIDPFTGSDFRYVLTGDGPMLYSTSENGVDDGGLHHGRWGEEPDATGDDFVFWPPQSR